MPRGHGGGGATGADPTNKRATWFVSLYISVCRNEDNAPRARRRRRYGRGPNKYTRNWEDEEAYAKTLATRGTVLVLLRYLAFRHSPNLVLHQCTYYLPLLTK